MFLCPPLPHAQVCCDAYCDTCTLRNSAATFQTCCTFPVHISVSHQPVCIHVLEPHSIQLVARSFSTLSCLLAWDATLAARKDSESVFLAALHWLSHRLLYSLFSFSSWFATSLLRFLCFLNTNNDRSYSQRERSCGPCQLTNSGLTCVIP